MKTSPFLINLIIYGPYVVLLILFLIFFYRAIRFYGVQKLKKFTVVMLGAFVVAFALRFFKFDFFDWVPIQFLKIAGNGNTTNLLILLMMIFFVTSITKIHIEKNARFLTLNWLLIGLFSVAFMGWLTYLYMAWEEPVKKNPTSLLQINVDLHLVRDFYLKQMIYPFLWVVVCCISLWKIKKEKRKLNYA